MPALTVYRVDTSRTLPGPRHVQGGMKTKTVALGRCRQPGGGGDSRGRPKTAAASASFARACYRRYGHARACRCVCVCTCVRVRARAPDCRYLILSRRRRRSGAGDRRTRRRRRYASSRTPRKVVARTHARTSARPPADRPPARRRRRTTARVIIVRRTPVSRVVLSLVGKREKNPRYHRPVTIGTASAACRARPRVPRGWLKIRGSRPSRCAVSCNARRPSSAPVLARGCDVSPLLTAELHANGVLPAGTARTGDRRGKSVRPLATVVKVGTPHDVWFRISRFAPSNGIRAQVVSGDTFYVDIVCHPLSMCVRSGRTPSAVRGMSSAYPEIAARAESSKRSRANRATRQRRGVRSCKIIISFGRRRGFVVRVRV